jgi:hypothetical protein
MQKKQMKETLNKMSKEDLLIQLKEHKKILFVIAPSDKKDATKLKLESYVLLSNLSPDLKKQIRLELGLVKPEVSGEEK